MTTLIYAKYWFGKKGVLRESFENSFRLLREARLSAFGPGSPRLAQEGSGIPPCIQQNYFQLEDQNGFSLRDTCVDERGTVRRAKTGKAGEEGELRARGGKQDNLVGKT